MYIGIYLYVDIHPYVYNPNLITMCATCITLSLSTCIPRTVYNPIPIRMPAGHVRFLTSGHGFCIRAKYFIDLLFSSSTLVDPFPNGNLAYSDMDYGLDYWYPSLGAKSPNFIR